MELAEAINVLSDLNRDRNPNFWDESTNGGAPHKPFLLLSILDGISEGWINSNKIYPTQNLVDYFFGYWDDIIGNDKSTTIALPYFHMKSEAFWNLVYKAGSNKYKTSPSWGGILNRIEYAEIDIGLLSLLQNRRHRQQIRNFILETYFGDVTSVKISDKSVEHQESFNYSNNLLSLVAEPFLKDHTSIADISEITLTKKVRRIGFSKTIREIYNYSCSVCRDKIITPGGKILVEGAHIIPWAESKNDDPRNGLSLCPTHHWMFDNFMFTIRNDFSVKVSRKLKTKDVYLTSLKSLKNAELELPVNSDFHPAQSALGYHYHQFEKVHKEWK